MFGFGRKPNVALPVCENFTQLSQRQQHVARHGFAPPSSNRQSALPGWEREAATGFVTLHLHDALPRNLINLAAQRRRLLQADRELTPEEKERLQAASPRQLELRLDQGEGCCALREPGVAAAMVSALRHHDGNRYRLLAWCLMPNHAHMVLRLRADRDPMQAMKSWRMESEHAARAVLGHKGRLWRREAFLHMLHSEEEEQRAIAYVMGNPERVGLENWPWVWKVEG